MFGILNCLCLSIPVRTDCCFSPDDKLLITGTSVKKDEGNGKLAFFDRMSFEKVHEIEVTNAVSSAPGSSGAGSCDLPVPKGC